MKVKTGEKDGEGGEAGTAAAAPCPHHPHHHPIFLSVKVTSPIYTEFTLLPGVHTPVLRGRGVT